MYLVIDRSQWRAINLLMVSIVYAQRAIPVYFTLLPKKGNSNLEQQQQVLSQGYFILKRDKICSKLNWHFRCPKGYRSAYA